MLEILILRVVVVDWYWRVVEVVVVVVHYHNSVDHLHYFWTNPIAVISMILSSVGAVVQEAEEGGDLSLTIPPMTKNTRYVWVPISRGDPAVPMPWQSRLDY